MRSFWLLIGFLLMFSFPVGEITVLPFGGFALILFATLRMKQMENAFVRVERALYVALPIAATLLALQIYKTAAGENAAVWYSAVYTTVHILCEVAEASVMALLYIGIKIIGMNADVPQLEKQCGRNMTLMAAYIISEIFITVMRLTVPESFVGFEVVLVYPFVLGYIWRAMNVWTAYTMLSKLTVTKH